jgi:NADH dehydrogenase FAD-containing subunit
MKKHLVLAGGGHAHMVALANLHRFVEKGYDVTVIGPSEHHYYSGMGPGLLGNTYQPENVRFATKRVVEKQGGRFVLGSIVNIDAPAQTVHLASGDTVSYDVLSCNLGSHVPCDMIAGPLEDVYLVKPIERLLEARERILAIGSRKQIAVGIVGGGPSAVEIAGNIWGLLHRSGHPSGHIKIFTHQTILARHPAGVRAKAEISLRRRGIEIVEHCRVRDVRSGVIIEFSGKTHELDVIFLAVGVQPNSVFKESGMHTGPGGGLRVNRYLQSTQHPNVFGGGDCIYFEDAPLDKVGVYAVRQNPVLFHNLMAALDGTALQVFAPGGDYLLIFNLGDGTGIFYKQPIQFGGRIAFFIKDYVDRKFMRKFQSIE